ncbi:hypothetical protein PR202_gb22236 [Eleusine coracana subsp. coracana]|uniref:BHLH domain-containing protein n=1 Tax=Eleusine coracana subsp. coracana TaxID=191504 RepID=A0AAV5FH71_ELECO|nr:hypothetical protein QOZ80_6AG0539580 [Eleusine coracana subsp. coracana]GJN33616.1 hypothetical protein PR202_gb22236 [Eleusine coracana subsp. coracana]
MYGSTVSKDLNLPAVQPPQMSSPGLLRYRSAPSNLLGEVCTEDFHPAADGGGAATGHHQRPDHAADAALARFLAGHHHHAEIADCKPPRPAAHFLDDAVSSMALQHQQQQQLMYQSQQQVAAMDGFYRNGVEHGAGVGSGTNLVRQSSSPAGFLNHLNMDNGYGNMLRAGGFRNGNGGGGLKGGQLSYSSRQGSVMSQISEVGSEELAGGDSSSPEAGSNGAAAARSYSGIPAAGYPMDGGWDDAPPDQGHHHHLSSGPKRPRDALPTPPNGHHHQLAPQLSLPSSGGNGKTSPDMAAIEKFLQFQDAVPCKIRAKRGCATHPRSIAERVRRTRISERIRKLQELVPNMEKQTNTADMLDLAVDYIKDLQKQVKELNDGRANCTCAASKRQNQFAC